MDPIDRAAVLDALDEQIKQCDRALNSFNISMKDEYAVKVERASLVAFRETLKYMPSVQPEPHWIQCSETVDIPNHEILACDKYGKEMFGYLAYEDDQWLCVSDNCMMYDPIAWREKPESYRGRR